MNWELASGNLARLGGKLLSWKSAIAWLVTFPLFYFMQARHSYSAIVLSTLSCLFLSLLLALARTPRFYYSFSATNQERSLNDYLNTDKFNKRIATIGIAGLFLTSSMDTFLVWNTGPFTLRFGQLCALILFMAAITHHLRLHEPLCFPYWQFFAAFAYLFMACISALWTQNLVKSIGYLAWAVFDIVVVWWGLILWITNRTRLRQAFLFWGCGMAIDAAMGAFQWCCWLFGYFPPLAYSDGYGFPRINGFSYEPSYYALYLVPGAIFFLTRFAFLGRSAWRSALASVALALLSMLSTSRSGWLGLAVGVIALGIIVAKTKGFDYVKSLALPLAGVIILFSTFLLAIPSTRERVVRLSSMAFNPLEKTSSQPRLKGMQQAWQMFSDHPWLGVGFGNYGAYVLAHPELQFPSPVSSDPQQAHELVTSNLYLELAAESGILGLSAALLMIAVLVLPLLRSKTNRFVNLLPDDLLEWEATRWGLLLASMVVFGVLFQFSQTLWRLDIWSFLALSCATYRISPSLRLVSKKGSPLHL